MVQALEESFLCFDATITTPEVMTILKELAGKFTLRLHQLCNAKNKL